MSSDLMIPLDHLRSGEWGEVCDVSGEPGWVSRLAELGLRVGCRFKMLRDGSPCMIQIGEGRFSFRLSETTQVLVRPLTSPA